MSITYQILGANGVTEPFSVLAEVPGGFPRSAWYGPKSSGFQFYRVREKQ